MTEFSKLDKPKEFQIKPNSKKWAADKLLPFIQACPHIIKPEIGVEQFVEELNIACTKFKEYFMKQD